MKINWDRKISTNFALEMIFLAAISVVIAAILVVSNALPKLSSFDGYIEGLTH